MVTVDMCTFDGRRGVAVAVGLCHWLHGYCVQACAAVFVTRLERPLPC